MKRLLTTLVILPGLFAPSLAVAFWQSDADKGLEPEQAGDYFVVVGHEQRHVYF